MKWTLKEAENNQQNIHISTSWLLIIYSEMETGTYLGVFPHYFP